MSHVSPSSPPRLFTFVGADQGPWAVRSARTLTGNALPTAPCLHVVEGAAVPPPGAAWALVTNVREPGRQLMASPSRGELVLQCLT
jgi:hypothetical protein